MTITEKFDKQVNILMEEALKEVPRLLKMKDMGLEMAITIVVRPGHKTKYQKRFIERKLFDSLKVKSDIKKIIAKVEKYEDQADFLEERILIDYDIADMKSGREKEIFDNIVAIFEAAEVFKNVNPEESQFMINYRK